MHIELNVEMNVQTQFYSDSEVSILNRQATAYADAKDFDKAVDCIKKANLLNHEYIAMFPSSGLRLALFLQKAKRTNEAIQEINKLLLLVPVATASYETNGNPSTEDVMASFEANEYFAIYDKLRLILQREKRNHEKELVQSLANDWQARSAAFYQRLIMRKTVKMPPRPECVLWAEIKQ